MLDRFTWYKQSALLWRGDVVVYVDPWGLPDGEPEADVLLITHAHPDHFSLDDIKRVLRDDTIVVAPHDVAGQLPGGDVRGVMPGETFEARGIAIETVPAYNVRQERLAAHPRENNWVGYITGLGGTRSYFAGDTDHIPEMAAVKTDVAFVPVGGTFSMDPSEAAGAIKQINPKLAVPYHFGFVIGSRTNGDTFVRAIEPVRGVVLEPVNEFQIP